MPYGYTDQEWERIGLDQRNAIAAASREGISGDTFDPLRGTVSGIKDLTQRAGSGIQTFIEGLRPVPSGGGLRGEVFAESPGGGLGTGSGAARADLANTASALDQQFFEGQEAAGPDIASLSDLSGQDLEGPDSETIFEETVFPEKEKIDKETTQGRALFQMGLGIGQWKDGVNSTSPKESLGGMLTFVGGMANLMMPKDMQNTGWGKFNLALGFLGTMVNLSGRRKDYKNQAEYQSDLQGSIGNALQNLDTI